MFTNLIESSSHAREFKRRGSFVLFTTTTYALLFIVAGVVSIYAYEARLEEPASEITMLGPVDIEPAQPEIIRFTKAPPSGAKQGGNAFVRKDPTAGVDVPQRAPDKASAAPNTNPPLPTGVPVKRGGDDLDPESIGPGTTGGRGKGGGGIGKPQYVDVETPPPAPIEKPKPKVVPRGVINGEALSLPKPSYPPIARQMRIEGTVNVQVLVDETGRVISAKALSGNPALVHAAQQAALNARFTPTILGDQAVKVSGVIVYNFVLQ